MPLSGNPRTTPPIMQPFVLSSERDIDQRVQESISQKGAPDKIEWREPPTRGFIGVSSMRDGSWTPASPRRNSLIYEAFLSMNTIVFLQSEQKSMTVKVLYSLIVSFGISNAVAYRYTGTMSSADTVHAVRQTNFAMKGVRYRGEEIG